MNYRNKTDLEIVTILLRDVWPMSEYPELVAEACERLRRAHGPARGNQEVCVLCGVAITTDYACQNCTPKIIKTLNNAHAPNTLG